MKHQENILSKIFNYSTCCYALKEPSEIFISQHDNDHILQFNRDHHYSSPSKPLICKMSENVEDIQISQQFLKQLHQANIDPQTAHLLAAESLAKIISYRNLQKGLYLQIPLAVKNKLEMVDYHVDIEMNLWQNISCYGLIPHLSSRYPPLLLFPGTDFSFSKRGRASMLSDLDPNGPGRTLFMHARSDIRKWLNQACKNKNARLFGHSLGAILACYVLIFEHEMISKEENSFIFNYPGIELDVYQKWMELDTSKKPKIKGFVGRGDVVSKYGFLFGPTFELSVNGPMQPVAAHTSLYFAHSFCNVAKIAINEENNSQSRKQYSKIYKKTSALFYHLGLKYFFPNQSNEKGKYDEKT